MKKVVVTASTKGIGRAIADKFLSEGCEVAVCARKSEELDDMMIASKKMPGRLHTFVCDVTDMAAVRAFYSFVNDKMGTIDILVNNAGNFEPGTIYGEEEGVFERQMLINVHSGYEISRLFLPEMIERKSGHIFNLCSVASIKAYTNGGSYCISKHAAYGMTRVLREELKPHRIKVTAILPGATWSGSWEGTTEPIERFMQPSDIAEMVYMSSRLSASAVVEEIVMRPMEGDIGD